MEDRSPTASAAPALAVVGGIVAVAGSLLVWAEASVGPASFSAKGVDGWEGKVTLLGGAILLVAGVSAFLGASEARARLRGSAVVGGLLAAGVGIYTAATARDQILDAAVTEVATQFGVPEATARSTLEAAMDRGELTLALKVGIWMVIAGGVLGAIAGLLAILRREPVPAPPVAVGPPGLTGWAVPEPPAPAFGSPSVWAPPPPVVDVPEGGSPAPPAPS